MRALIIYNPMAGNGRGGALADVARERLEAADGSVTVTQSLPRERLDTPACKALCDKASQAEVVLVVGGDSTVREVLTDLQSLDRLPPIALIPAGNANVLAREYGIPLEASAAADLVLQDHDAEVDCGTANGELFLAMAGIGYDAIAVRWLHRIRRTRLGAWLYRLPGGADTIYALVGTAALFRVAPVRVRVASDGDAPLEGFASVAVLNTAQYAKHWSLAPEACAHDGWLNTRLERGAFFLRPLLAILSAMLRRYAPAFVASYGKIQTMRINADAPFAWQLDGEPMAPVHDLAIGIRPGYFRLVVPPPPVAP